MDQQPPMPPPPSSSQSLFEMDFDALAQNHLNSISKWGKFIGITAMVILILFLVALAASYEQALDQVREVFALNESVLTTTLVIVGVILVLCIVWLIYLLRACSLIKAGLVSQNSDRVAEGFKSLKTVFTVGIIFSILSIISTAVSMFNL